MSDKYVATTGNDTTGDGTLGNPYATVNKALSVLGGAGDTIYIRAGTYNQLINIDDFQGTEFAPVTIKNYNDETVIIQGDGSSNYCVYFVTCSWVIVSGLYIHWNHSIAPPDWKMPWVKFVNSNDCKIYFCNLTRTWQTTGGVSRTLEQEYAAERTPAVQFGVGATRCGVEACYITGVNKGVQWNGISQDCYVIGSNIVDTVQSNIDIALLLTGSTSRAGCLIEDNELDGSFMEDNIQTHNSSVPTATTERGVIIRGNRIRRARENAIDLKNAQYVLIEDNDISGSWGSNDGSHATLGNNRNSMFSLGSGGSEPPATHVIIRNNKVYDVGGSITPLDYWMIYNNAIVACNRDYTGGESVYNDASQSFPKFLALTLADANTHIGFRNNLVALNNTVGTLLRDAITNYNGDYNCYSGNDAISCVWANNAWPLKTLAELRTYITSRGWTGGGEQNSFELAFESIGFGNVPNRPSDTDTDLDWSYSADSPLVDTGGHLTTTTGSGTGSTTLSVVDAHWFFDGFGRSDQSKDIIYIEGVGERQITAINYTTNVITLGLAATWSNGAKVWLGTDDTPNIGLDNLPTTTPPPALTGGNSPAGVGREAAILTASQQTFELSGIDVLNSNPLVLTIINGATSESGVNGNPAMTSVGVGNATAQRSIQQIAKNGYNPAADIRRSSDTKLAQVQSTTNGTILATLNLDSISATDIKATWSAALPAAYMVHNIVFNSAESYITDLAPSTTVGGSVSFDPGFVADALIIFGNGKAVPNTTGNADYMLSVGFACMDGLILRQGSVCQRDTNGTPTNVHSRISDDYAYQQLNTNGSILSGLEVTAIGSTCTITTRLFSPGSPNDIVVAAIQINSPMYVGAVSGGASNLNYFVTGTGVGTGLNMFLGTLHSTANVDNTTGNTGGAMSFGLAIPQAQFAWGQSISNGVATSVTNSYSKNNVAMLTRQHDGSEAISAVLTSFDTSGYHMTFTTQSGFESKQYLLFSIGGVGHTVICTPMPVGTATTLGSVVRGAFTKTCTPMPVTTGTQIGSVTTGGFTLQCTPMPISTVTVATPVLGPVSVTCTPMPVTTATNSGMRVVSVLAGARIFTLRKRRTLLQLPSRIVMSTSIREIIESPLEQGEDEEIPYVINTTPWGGSPTLLGVEVKRQQRDRSWVDVTNSTTSGEGYVANDYVVTPYITGLVAGNVYRVEILMYIASRTEEAYLILRATE